MWKRHTDGSGKGTHRREAAAVSSRCGNGRRDGKPVAEERRGPAEKTGGGAGKRGRGAAWSKKSLFFSSTPSPSVRCGAFRGQKAGELTDKDIKCPSAASYLCIVKSDTRDGPDSEPPTFH